MSLSEDIFNKTEGNSSFAKIITDAQGTVKNVEVQKPIEENTPSQNPMTIEDINKNYNVNIVPEIPNDLKPGETVNSFVVATEKKPQEKSDIPPKTTPKSEKAEKSEKTNLVKQYYGEKTENVKKKVNSLDEYMKEDDAKKYREFQDNGSKAENPEIARVKTKQVEELEKRQRKEKEEIERITKEAEKKAIHQKELESNEKANEGFDAEKPLSRGGQDALAKQDEMARRIKMEEDLSSLKEELAQAKEEIASLKEDFIRLWKEKLDSTPLETTPEEEDVPDWVEQISKEPEETTPQPESTEPEDVEPTPQPEITEPEETTPEVIPMPPHTPDSTEPEDTTPEVIPMPPHTPEPEDENQQIINVDSKDIIDVEPQEQGIIPSPQHEIIDVSFDQEDKDIDQQRRERNYKRIALVAGFVTGATTGMVVGSAAIPPIGISVAVAAGATTLGRALVGRGIRNIENRLQQAQTPEEKASLERRLNSYNTIHRRLGYVKSFLTGGAFGLLAANFFSSTYFGGESILGNQATSTSEIAPDITTEVPQSQEVGTGSILENTPPSAPEVAELPDISDGWLETNQFGWDTSKFGWQGTRLYVPTEGVVPGGAPDLQAKFVDALFNQGISKTHLMGQEAGSLFNEGLINAAYRGQDVEQVAKATAEALKGLVR